MLDSGERQEKTKIKVQRPKTKKSNSDDTRQALRQACVLDVQSKFYGQAKGLISIGQLSTLLHLHFQPINLVVYEESHCQD